MLERTRGGRTALPLARGILEPPAERDNVDDDAEELALVLVLLVVVVAAARCAPSFAMMREREMRGFRVDGCAFIFVVVVIVVGDAGARLVVGADASRGRSELWVPLRAVALVVVVVASAVAAAAREVGLTGGGMTAWFGDCISSGVVNIFPGDEGTLPGPPWGLFVIASRTAALRGGVLGRCAMMVLVLDFLMVAVAAPEPGTAAGLRIFARELAVGANNRDVVLLGLKMEALLLLPLPASSAAISVLSSEGARAAGFIVLLLAVALEELARTL
jgi:hypothetical protein